MKFSIQEILQATGGKLIQGDTSVVISAISTDTRTLQPQDLFLALKGENFNGHHFIATAIGKKAAGLLVSEPCLIRCPNLPVIRVKDTTLALGQLALFHRRRFSIPIIALTGSAGKTTTKEMIAAVLQTRFKVLKNIATENNHIGVPATLLKLDASHEVAVIEFGTNCFGDIRWLTQICEPTIVLLTNIGESHLEFLKTPAGVFKEKADIFKHKPAPKIIIYNADDAFLKKIPQLKTFGKLISFGIENPADYQATGIKIEDNRRIVFHLNRKKKFELDTPVYHTIYNSLAAIVCGRIFKLDDATIQKGLKQNPSPKNRQALKNTGQFWVIDDTYNANPVSVKSALKTLCSLQTDGRRVMVCADMLELGTRSQTLHTMVGRLAAESGLDAVFTIGKYSKWITTAAKKGNKNLTAYHCRTIDHVHNRLKQYCRSGDVILVKGSRGMKMERTISFLAGNFQSETLKTTVERG